MKKIWCVILIILCCGMLTACNLPNLYDVNLPDEQSEEEIRETITEASTEEMTEEL